MYCTWFTGTFLSFSKFTQIKEWDQNSWGEPILQYGWIIWSLLLYFNLKNWNDAHSTSFIRFQCILHDSVAFLWDWKSGNLFSWQEHTQDNRWIIWSPFLFFNFENLNDQIFCHSLGFNTSYVTQIFCMIFLKFPQIKGGGTKFFGWVQFCRRCELLGPPSGISIFQFSVIH